MVKVLLIFSTVAYWAENNELLLKKSFSRSTTKTDTKQSETESRIGSLGERIETTVAEIRRNETIQSTQIFKIERAVESNKWDCQTYGFSIFDFLFHTVVFVVFLETLSFKFVT